MGLYSDILHSLLKPQKYYLFDFEKYMTCTVTRTLVQVTGEMIIMIQTTSDVYQLARVQRSMG